jgi:hypothetical protein
MLHAVERISPMSEGTWGFEPHMKSRSSVYFGVDLLEVACVEQHLKSLSSGLLMRA